VGIHWRGALGTGIAALAIAGCGDEDDYANEPRPPSPITVTASISDERVSVSPDRFGAGPITLVVTNQTGRSRELLLETDEPGGTGQAGVRQQAGPINPRGTASLKADLRAGTYVVRVSNEEIRPARVTVGRQRESAQNELLQP
jgi:hypothetical protein